jgi:O-glycosyl hydrolase
VITPNVEYYALGHLGKFVQPGAYRIDSNTYGSGSVEDVAFQNPDGSVVLLVLNAASAQFHFRGDLERRQLHRYAAGGRSWRLMSGRCRRRRFRRMGQ